MRKKIFIVFAILFLKISFVFGQVNYSGTFVNTSLQVGGTLVMNINFLTNDSINGYGGASSGLGYSAFGGARIMLSKNFGVYGELGYTSLAIFSGGLTFNLK